MRRLGLGFVLLLALSGCGAAREKPELRPTWNGAMIDGIAPLMTPSAVSNALQQRNYHQVPCALRGVARPDMLNRGDEPVCFEVPDRPLRVWLNFFDLKEGRRLAIANFHERDLYSKSPQARINAGRAMARRLRARLGAPLTTSRNQSFVTLYWGVPGGSPSLPDLISTTVGADFGVDISMTSFWAYAQLREPR